MLTTEQMVALCGAHLIKELAYLRSFLPSCTEKDNNREGMALPCENPEGNNVQHIWMMTLYSHERYSHEEIEEVIEEIKPSFFRQMPQVASTAVWRGLVDVSTIFNGCTPRAPPFSSFIGLMWYIRPVARLSDADLQSSPRRT